MPQCYYPITSSEILSGTHNINWTKNANKAIKDFNLSLTTSLFAKKQNTETITEKSSNFCLKTTTNANVATDENGNTDTATNADTNTNADSNKNISLNKKGSVNTNSDIKENNNIIITKRGCATQMIIMNSSVNVTIQTSNDNNNKNEQISNFETNKYLEIINNVFKAIDMSCIKKLFSCTLCFFSLITYLDHSLKEICLMCILNKYFFANNN